MIDILFTSVPVTDTNEAIMAPGLLKAVAIKNGFTSNAIDLNIELFLLMQKHENSDHIVSFFIWNDLYTDAYDDIIKFIDCAAERILSFNPKIVGLSLLTVQCQTFTKWLCVRLKSISPETKIIIGGTGIKRTLAGNDNTFCEELKTQGLIDHYITGDGEEALIELLNDNIAYPGIDSTVWKEIKDIDHFPYPDYHDYNFSLYELPGIPITDSRGCVRQCEFCDLIEHWKKYVYRSAESVFAEMVHQVEQYKIYHFPMKNSLTNGNLREFKKLLTYMAEYNENKDKSVQMSWRGYFIIRSMQQHPEEIWELMNKSNAVLLLGVESVIQHVRWGLGKKFNNEDIDYHLEMGRKYQIPLRLLLMIAYPTETREDFEFTKQWFKDRTHYAANSVKSVHWAHASILDNTKLDKNSIQMNLVKGKKYGFHWINQTTQITPAERAKYGEELFEICKPFHSESKTMKRNIEKITQINLELNEQQN